MWLFKNKSRGQFTKSIYGILENVAKIGKIPNIEKCRYMGAMGKHKPKWVP